MKSVRIGKVKLNERCLTLFICTLVVFFAQISENYHALALLMLGYAIVLSWALSCSASMLMAMILFFLSDNSILDAGGISIQLVIMCIYLLRFAIFRKKGLYAKTLLAGLAISVYSLIYIYHGIGYVLQGVKLAVMIIYLTEYLSNSEALSRGNYANQLSFSVLGVFISVVAAICVNPSILLQARVALSKDSNWNLLGILSALLFSHSFVMCFVDRKQGTKYIIFSIMMAVCAVISTSRTALLVAAIGAVWTLFFINTNGTLARKGFVFIALVIFLMLLANGIIKISFVDNLVNRIINPRRGDISNGRFTLWAGYIEYLTAHKMTLLFGYGRTLIEGITTGTSTASNMAHNMVIEQITMYGIIGSGIVVLLYVFSINRISRRMRICNGISQYKIKYLITTILVFVAGMFSHIITSVLVTMELYLGLMQYIALSAAEKQYYGDDRE